VTNYPVDKNYSEALRKLEPTDPTHSDTFNPLFNQLLNNDAKLNELLAGKANTDDVASANDITTINNKVNDLGINAKSFTGGIHEALIYAETAAQKKVYVPDGIYNVDKTVEIPSGIHLELAPNAVLKLTADVNAVQLKPDSKLTGGVIDASGITFTKACIYLNGNDVFKLLNDHLYGNGTVLKGKDHEYTDQAWTGIGIHLYSGKGIDHEYAYVSFVRFMQMGIFNFEYGILLETDETITNEAEMAWVNGNTFDQINFMNCRKNITLKGDSNIPRDVSGNSFSNIQMQVNAYTDWAINCEGGWNRFEGTWWDLHRMPDDTPAFIFGATSRFNKIESMHGYETPRHYKDSGYMNTIASLTNHVPDNRTLFHPLPTPYKPNSLGNQDDYLVGGHLRGYTVAQVMTTDPYRRPTITLPEGMDEVDYIVGNYNTLFTTNTEYGVTWDGTQTDYDNPIVLEIDLTSDPIPLCGHVGIVSAYDAYPQNLVIEVYDGTKWLEHGDWILANTQNNLAVSGPYAGVQEAQKIRLTFWGSNKPDGLIQISRVFGMSTTTRGNAFIPKDGGTVDGTINFKGGLLVETRLDDPPNPEVGRLWLRTDLDSLRISTPTGVRLITMEEYSLVTYSQGEPINPATVTVVSSDSNFTQIITTGNGQGYKFPIPSSELSTGRTYNVSVQVEMLQSVDDTISLHVRNITKNAYIGSFLATSTLTLNQKQTLTGTFSVSSANFAPGDVVELWVVQKWNNSTNDNPFEYRIYKENLSVVV
jgi:hypothetical protein